jgi:hypothetical protein
VSGTAPELAVVALSVGSPPELRTAVESLKRQSVPVAIVVVNSGGGDPRAVLSGLDTDVGIVSESTLLWPGGARNRGLRATRAPWIASWHVITLPRRTGLMPDFDSGAKVIVPSPVRS